jgi:hypothetical protein
MKKIAYVVLCPLVFVAFLAAQKFPDTCANGKTPHFPSKTAMSIDNQCGLNGAPPQGHPEEGLQNQAKNNFCADAATAEPIKLSEIESLQGDAETQEKKNHFTPGQPPPDRAFVKTLGEGHLVVFEGFVFHARQECKETVNCGTTPPNVNASHDIHIALLEQPRKTQANDPKPDQDKEECTGFVAEMIPHHRPAEWTACSVNDVAGKGLRVRVTGQQFFDGSHVPCKNGAPQGSNPKRVSLWEIHPIYSFEVCPSGDCTHGGWQPLETFAAGKTECPEADCKVKKNTGTGNHAKKKKGPQG